MKKYTASILAIAAMLSVVLSGETFAVNMTWDNTAGGAINDDEGAWLGAGLWNNGSPSAS